MSAMVTFNGVQVPEADVLKAASEIENRRFNAMLRGSFMAGPEQPKPVETGVYRWHHRTDADPFAAYGSAIWRKNAEGSWDYAEKWGGEWRSCVSIMDLYVRDGSLVPLQPVEGVEYKWGSASANGRYRWHKGHWELVMDDGLGWRASSQADDFWRTGQLRPVAKAEPWTPKEGEWVQHKTQPWDKARQVVAVVLDRVRLGNDWMALDCVRKATPDEEAAAKRIELVDRLIVRYKLSGSVWQYWQRESCWVRQDGARLNASECALHAPNFDLDHYDILPEYTVQGAR